MADNREAYRNAATQTTSLGNFAFDEIGGILFGRTKLTLGADGVNDGDVSAANPLPITGVITSITGVISLPTGASTAVLQTTGNTSLASIDGKTPALVSGRVPVDGSGVIQPVSGTFWQATQPVSAASLPLPTGAATLSEQQSQTTPLTRIAGKYLDFDSGLGTDSAVAIGLLLPGVGGAVIGGTTTNPIRFDPTGTTPQPVTGTFFQATQPVSLASLPTLPAGDNNIGNIDVLSVPADPFGTNADAAATNGSISAKLRAIATNGIPITGTVAVTGTVTANAGTNLNTSLLALESGGNLAAIATSASVLDDWDETNRCAVNPIAGQVGLQGGSGNVSDNTLRVALAANVSLPTGSNVIGAVTQSGSWSINSIVGGVSVDGAQSHDASGATTDPVAIGGYASAAAPTDVSDDVDVVRGWFLKNGAQATVLTAAGALIGGDATNGLDVDVTRLPLSFGAGAVAATTQRVTHASDDPVTASLNVMDDWDETDRCKVNLIAGQAGISAGAGSVAATTPRVTLASDDPAVASLSVLDDWDEANRAAVNVIAGQVGAQGGAGVVTALTLRVALATDANVVDTELPAAAALDDATGNPTTSMVGSATMLWNGSAAWVRARQTGNGLNLNGAGVQAVGLFAQFDDVAPSAVTENQFANLRMGSDRVIYIQGQIAHGSADSGNPTKVGGRARSTDYTAEAADDRVDALFSLLGKLVTIPHSLPGQQWQYAAASGGITNTTGVTIKAAGAAGVRNYIDYLQIINLHATVSTEVEIRDGASGTVIVRIPCQAGGGGCACPVRLKGTAATLLEVACVTTGAQVYVNAQGHTAAEG